MREFWVNVYQSRSQVLRRHSRRTFGQLYDNKDAAERSACSDALYRIHVKLKDKPNGH